MTSDETGSFGVVAARRRARRGRGRSAGPLAELLEVRQLLAVITVNTTGDADGADGSATLSLRQAIEVANGSLAVASLTASQALLVSGPLSTPDTIDFAIPGTGPFTISPAIELPTITVPVIIDGYSQAGARPNTNGLGFADNAVIMVEISGDNIPTITTPNGAMDTGLVVAGGDSTVQGLAFVNFHAAMSFPVGQTDVTTYLGIGISLQNKGGNVVRGNFIGLDTNGSLGNSATGFGVMVANLTGSGTSDTIGGTAASDRNVISGNFSGISSAGGVLVEGNFIGTDPSGTRKPTGNLPYFGSPAGVSSSFGDTIGGTVEGARNVISGNGSGITNFSGMGGVGLIQGNLIGTDLTGTRSLGNVNGIKIVADFLGRATIGGTTSATRNVISGNTAYGLFAQSTASIIVEGNFIGTDLTGTQPIPNGVGFGTLSFNFNTIGGSAAGAGNVISGNSGNGLSLAGSSNLVEGNFIGTDFTGTKAVPNSDGLLITANSDSNTIGGTVVDSGNVISGNSVDGIVNVLGAVGSLVVGNFIGTDASGKLPLPNARDGILFENGPFNTIGGTTAGAGNVIAFNGRSGVGIESINDVSFDNGSSPNSETISGNSIYSNGGLGIDLGIDGVTPNSPGGAPHGPNRLQPYPVLLSANPGTAGGLITATLTAVPSTLYTIEFFANPSAAGPAQVFLGSMQATTDATGFVQLSFVNPSAVLGQPITATATDPLGDTSEFAAPILVSSPSVPTIPPLMLISPTSITLDGPTSLVTSDQILTFTAIVKATSGSTPTGKVAFLEDGTVIGVVPVDSSGTATFTTTIPFIPGLHTVSATFLGDVAYASSLSSSLVVGVVPNLNFGGPTVTSAMILNSHSVKVSFSRALLHNPAQTRANYKIISPDGHSLSIKNATYNPTNHSVTLTTRQALHVHRTYRLRINGVQIGRVADINRIPLAGSNGNPGTSYVGAITPKGPHASSVHAVSLKLKAHTHNKKGR